MTVNDLSSHWLSHCPSLKVNDCGDKNKDDDKHNSEHDDIDDDDDDYYYYYDDDDHRHYHCLYVVVIILHMDCFNHSCVQKLLLHPRAHIGTRCFRNVQGAESRGWLKRLPKVKLFKLLGIFLKRSGAMAAMAQKMAGNPCWGVPGFIGSIENQLSSNHLIMHIIIG